MNYNSFVKVVDENYFAYQERNKEKIGCFLQELEKLLSKNFGIPSCEVKITELSASRFAFGHIPPAAFKNNGKAEVAIVFNEKILFEYSYIKIVKLLLHEWTHYLTYYYLHVDNTINISKRYLDFILKSDEVKTLNIHDIQNLELAQALQKLSPAEFVADLFARDVLVEIEKFSKNPILAAEAKNKVQREEDRLQNQFLQKINRFCKKNYTNAAEIEFCDIVNSYRNQDKEQTPT